MATKRDLVEAHQFSRRRLITAFVSGAPGGREVEPARPGRALVGGLALALLVVAGGAVTGLIFGRDEADWKQPGLVISKERGPAVPREHSRGRRAGDPAGHQRHLGAADPGLGVGADVRLRGRHHRRADRRADRHPQRPGQRARAAGDLVRVGLDRLHERGVRAAADAGPEPGGVRGTRRRVPRREPWGPVRHRPGGVRARRAAQRLLLRAARRPRHPGQPAARPRAERRRRRREGDHGLVVAVAGGRRARVVDVRDRRRGSAAAVRRRLVRSAT